MDPSWRGSAIAGDLWMCQELLMLLPGLLGDRVVIQGSLLSTNSFPHNQTGTRQFFLPCSGLSLLGLLLFRDFQEGKPQYRFSFFLQQKEGTVVTIVRS